MFAKSTVAVLALPIFNISVLDVGSVLACLTIFGKVDQSLFPRKDVVSIPHVVVCKFWKLLLSLPCLRF